MLVPTARLCLRLLPDAAAFRLATFLAAVPQRRPLDGRDRAHLESAERLPWGPANRHVALAWGDGPTVVLVHGWGGGALQMAPLARHLASIGFRAIAPDLTGHGLSPGRQISFRQLTADIAQLARDLHRPWHALVGHSAGGLTMMAARAAGAVRADRYVCLNAPRAPYPPITTLRRLVRPRESVLARCRAHFDAQFDFAPEPLYAGAAFASPHGGRLLLIYDRADDQVEVADADRIARRWPGALIWKTEGLGHHRVLWNRAVHERVGAFLSGALDAPLATPAAHESLIP